ncbi:MAG: TRAP transporter small permease subunit [Spirochaetes bacterium]|nr:TRAP transporter small permease subunit [Spirochaetota bacterium]
MAGKIVIFIKNVELAVLSVLGLGATTIMVVNATGRYILGSSIAWAEEVVRILYVWAVFIAISHGFIEHQHIGFKNISSSTRTTRYLSDVLYAASLSFVGSALSYYGWMYNSMTGAVPLPGTNLPTAILMLPGILSGILWTILGIIRLYQLVFIRER